MPDYEEMIERAVREAGYPGRRERLFLHRMVCNSLKVRLADQGLSERKIAEALTTFDETFERLDEQFQNVRDFGRYAGFQYPWPDAQADAEEDPSKRSLVVARIGRSLWQLVILVMLIAVLSIVISRW